MSTNTTKPISTFKKIYDKVSDFLNQGMFDNNIINKPPFKFDPNLVKEEKIKFDDIVIKNPEKVGDLYKFGIEEIEMPYEDVFLDLLPMETIVKYDLLRSLGNRKRYNEESRFYDVSTEPDVMKPSTVKDILSDYWLRKFPFFIVFLKYLYRKKFKLPNFKQINLYNSKNFIDTFNRYHNSNFGNFDEIYKWYELFYTSINDHYKYKDWDWWKQNMYNTLYKDAKFYKKLPDLFKEKGRELFYQSSLDTLKQEDVPENLFLSEYVPEYNSIIKEMNEIVEYKSQYGEDNFAQKVLKSPYYWKTVFLFPVLQEEILVPMSMALGPVGTAIAFTTRTLYWSSFIYNRLINLIPGFRAPINKLYPTFYTQKKDENTSVVILDYNRNYFKNLLVENNGNWKVNPLFLEGKLGIEHFLYEHEPFGDQNVYKGGRTLFMITLHELKNYLDAYNITATPENALTCYKAFVTKMNENFKLAKYKDDREIKNKLSYREITPGPKYKVLPWKKQLELFRSTFNNSNPDAVGAPGAISGLLNPPPTVFGRFEGFMKFLGWIYANTLAPGDLASMAVKNYQENINSGKMHLYKGTKAVRQGIHKIFKGSFSVAIATEPTPNWAKPNNALALIDSGKAWDTPLGSFNHVQNTKYYGWLLKGSFFPAMFAGMLIWAIERQNILVRQRGKYVPDIHPLSWRHYSYIRTYAGEKSMNMNELLEPEKYGIDKNSTLYIHNKEWLHEYKQLPNKHDPVDVVFETLDMANIAKLIPNREQAQEDIKRIAQQTLYDITSQGGSVGSTYLEFYKSNGRKIRIYPKNYNIPNYINPVYGVNLNNYIRYMKRRRFRSFGYQNTYYKLRSFKRYSNRFYPRRFRRFWRRRRYFIKT